MGMPMPPSMGGAPAGPPPTAMGPGPMGPQPGGGPDPMAGLAAALPLLAKGRRGRRAKHVAKRAAHGKARRRR